MPPKRDGGRLPAWTLLRCDDPRERPGAMEASAFASAEWARTIHAASNRAWTNAAKVIARLASERPEARYVEGWASKGGVADPVWHAWVDVPLGASAVSWLRIDPTPLWRWMMEHNAYGPVLEVSAAEMAPLVAPLLSPRGRALCRLPLVPLVPIPKLGIPQPRPADSFGAELGGEAALRAIEVREALIGAQRERSASTVADGKAEIDRLAAMRVLPRGG